MIIRGTTPPIRFTFSDVNPLEMTAAFLTVRQNDVTIEKELSSAVSVTAFTGAAMWVATTFGTASTGTAISTLSGAAATKAALAWLGGGALSAGGGGVAAGNALLAMAGPVGWTIAGATLLTSIVIFTSKKTKLNKEKNSEIETVKKNTVIVKELDAEINQILKETGEVRDGLNGIYMQCLELFGKDYSAFTSEQKKRLGSLVNYTKTLSALFGKTVTPVSEESAEEAVE